MQQTPTPTPPTHITTYRIAWYHQQGITPATHQGTSDYTIIISPPFDNERPVIYGMGCTHRCECNYNYDDEVLFNPRRIVARVAGEDVVWDTRVGAHPEGLVSLKLTRARDDAGHRFLDLYMHLWDQGAPLDVLIIGKEDVNGEKARLTDAERVRLGIPLWAWARSEEVGCGG